MPDENAMASQMKCPKCGKQIARTSAALKRGSTIKCGCGATITFTNDGFTKAQKGIDEMTKAFKKITGK